MKTRRAQSPSSSCRRKAPPPPVFPDDLIVEILSWLPVKSLLKFRCVCKSWKSLILDPNFVKLHLHRSSRNPKILLVWRRKFHRILVPYCVRSLPGNPTSTIDEDDCYPLTDPIGSEYPIGSEFVGSCNGLVCLLGHCLRNGFSEKCFYLCNPTTKITSKDLARLPVNDNCYNYSFAFGYDNLSDTYKVLAFGYNFKAKEESEKKQVRICSLGDNPWRNVSFPIIPFYNDDRPENNNGVYFDDTLNWLALCNIESGDYVWDDTNTITIAQLVIISLDLGMETCTQLLLPSLDEAPPVEPTIGVLTDCLCFSHDSNTTHFVVWQMKEFGVEKSWTQFMKISYQDLQIEYYDLDYPLLPLCKSENGDILMMATAVGSQAIFYHRRDNRVERTERTSLPNSIDWSETMDYVESLVLPCCKRMLMMRHKDWLEHSSQGSTK